MEVLRDAPASTSINPAELRATRPVVAAVYTTTGCGHTARLAAVRLGATQGQDWSQEADFAVREMEHSGRPFLVADMVEPFPARA
jgi:hypothetical protein